MHLSATRTRWGFAAFVVITLTADTCDGGGDVSDTTTTLDESVAVATTEVGPDTATTFGAPVEEGSVSESGPTTSAGITEAGLDCLDFWSEEFVQATAGSEFTFSDMNNDGTLCSFLALPNSIGVFFRPGDQNIFDQAKSAADAVGGVMEMNGVCNDAWYFDLGVLVAEGFSASQGRIFNATILADDPVAVAEELLQIACDGPAFK